MTPNPKEKVEEMDRKIADLSRAVDSEKAATQDVVHDLRVKLRHNRLLNSAIRAASGASGETPLLLPNYKRD